MKNVILIQNGAGENKDIAFVDYEMVSIDSRKFIDYRSLLNIKKTINIYSRNNPFIRIFKKGYSYNTYLLSGVFKEKDNLGRNLGFICFYIGSEKDVVKYLVANTSSVNLNIDGIQIIGNKFKDILILKRVAIGLLIILVTLIIYGKL